ncbi:RHS repeat-associated core domain-containing protein [Variovorax sp. OK212]|nr:RHS repeat-associated core domain-containing protein [Variovorax sp. OK202]SFE80865.1 RHS repeat-associated core domain-containing protein [Variovorax sp. OK212]
MLAFESTQSRSALKEGSEQGWSVHYIHEAGSFVPLVQVRQARAMALNETTDAKALMEANGGVYDIEQDPLWNGEQRNAPYAFDRKEMAFYQCDHLGTPQELTDHEGSVAWSAQYKAWGEAREAISEAGRRAGFRNPIRFQGQHFDEVTGLHYNRYRYYEPQSGSFVSNDPIKLAGGVHLNQYAPNPVAWVDPLGLSGKPLPNGTSVNRIGGNSVENLRLKPVEAILSPPGISTLHSCCPCQASSQMKEAYPKATGLQELADTVATGNAEAIRGAEFDVIEDPSKKFRTTRE